MATGDLLRLTFGPGVQRLLGPPVGGPPGESGVLLDAVLKEEVEHDAEVTEFPIEIGAAINDHVIVRPPIYVMTGVVTDTPHRFPQTNYGQSDDSSRSSAAWAMLVALHARALPFEITTNFQVYGDMVIQNLKSKKDAATRNVITFEARLRQLNIVSTTPPAPDPTALAPGQATAGAGGVVDQGKQPGTEVAAGSSSSNGVAAILGP
jgi:hypothetical protein